MGARRGEIGVEEMEVRGGKEMSEGNEQKKVKDGFEGERERVSRF